MAIVGYALVILGMAFIFVGGIAGTRDLFAKHVTAAQVKGLTITLPNVGDIIKELIKTKWGLFIAVGLLLVILGLGVLGVNIKTT
jgi:hypothetical protein